VELRDLRYFVAVADHLGFSRAAQSLDISQPALSRQIKLLENELGVRLFDRVGRRTMLTAAGADLLDRGRALLHESESIKGRAAELAGGSRGLLRLGATPHAYESFVSRLLARFRCENPQIEITLIEEGAADLVEAVKLGSIHVAVASLPVGTGLEGRPLFPFGVVAVVPRSHPLASRKSVDVTQLASHPLLLMSRSFLTRQLFDGACQSLHVTPKVVLESSSAQSLVALAENGQGVAILPSTVRLGSARQRVIPLQHSGKPLGLWMSVIWEAKRYLTPAATSFIQVAYEFTRGHYPGKKFHFEQHGLTPPPASLGAISPAPQRE
jgi:DNA-binding transcriptional LysR family regulator